jgi:hypothetical protein
MPFSHLHTPTHISPHTNHTHTHTHTLLHLPYQFLSIPAVKKRLTPRERQTLGHDESRSYYRGRDHRHDDGDDSDLVAAGGIVAIFAGLAAIQFLPDLDGLFEDDDCDECSIM